MSERQEEGTHKRAGRRSKVFIGSVFPLLPTPAHKQTHSGNQWREWYRSKACISNSGRNTCLSGKKNHGFKYKEWSKSSLRFVVLFL